MLIKFKGYGDKDVYINPQYVTSVSTENSTSIDEKYTLVCVVSKSDPYIINQPIQEVVELLSRGTV
jgi:hypothetical protein